MLLWARQRSFRLRFLRQDSNTSFPLKYYRLYIYSVSSGVQIFKLFLHNYTISATAEEPPMPPELTARQFKYNLKDGRNDADLCFSAEGPQQALY